MFAREIWERKKALVLTRGVTKTEKLRSLLYRKIARQGDYAQARTLSVAA
jgi:hypothetical protein